MGAEQDRFELAEQLAAIVEGSTDAIIGTSLDGIITSWNTGAQLIFGYTAAQIIGRPSSLLIPPETAPQLVTILERVRRGEGVEHFEARRLHKDGSIIELSSTISPIRDAAGAVVGLSTVGRDMTERNRAEAERRALAHELHQAERLQSLGQLAAGIAHDFNNLLGAIMNYAEFVAEQTADRPAVRADAEQIQERSAPTIWRAPAARAARTATPVPVPRSSTRRPASGPGAAATSALASSVYIRPGPSAHAPAAAS